jgi:hypothetical protein
MKKIFIKSLFAALLSICLTGCTKDLDLSPLDSISDASFWKTPDDFRKAANALYAALPGFTTFDLDSDIAFNNPNSISNSTSTTPDTDGNWNSPYTRIRNCNNLLEKASASPIAADIKECVAEAKFFRAWNYWSLYRLYGGVPLVTKVLEINSEELYGTRNSARETVDFILQDLKDAIPDLPEESQVSTTDKGRITKGAANALRARIALYEGTWRKFRNDGEANSYLDIAVEAANTVIGSGQYSLFNSGSENNYFQIFDNEGDNSPECILDRRYEPLVSQHSFTRNHNSCFPTKQLADMYLCTDGLPVDKSPLFRGYEQFTSEYENRDPRMAQTIMPPKTVAYSYLIPDVPIENWPFYPNNGTNWGYIFFKYYTQTPNAMIVPYLDQQGWDRHLIRYAEVLLIYAEAMFEKNGSISDDDLDKTVNLIRQRAGLSVPLTNAFVQANGLDMREEIRRERTVELALENFRWDDLRRWKTAEIELKKAVRGIKIVGTEWGTQPVIIEGVDHNSYPNPEWQNRTDAEGFIISESAEARSGFNPDKHYLRPIPAKEIQLNPNLQQNPGW